MNTTTINQWTVHIIKGGESYGATNSLKNDSDEPLIEFFDSSKVSPVRPFGQFVNRYFLSTLLERENECGLLLDGANPQWTVNAQDMLLLMQWAKNVTTNKPILHPVNAIVDMLQDELSKNANGAFSEPKEAFIKAMEHAKYCLSLAVKADNQSELVAQLDVLVENEW
jgi:hypothetical protein